MRKWMALLIVLVVALFCAYLHAAEPPPPIKMYKYQVAIRNEAKDTMYLNCVLAPSKKATEEETNYR